MDREDDFPVSMAFSPQAQRVMKRAEAAAKGFGQRAICSEHLLLAVLEENDGVAVQIADSYGDSASICRQLEQVLATPTVKGSNEMKLRLFHEWQQRHRASKRQTEGKSTQGETN